MAGQYRRATNIGTTDNKLTTKPTCKALACKCKAYRLKLMRPPVNAVCASIINATSVITRVRVLPCKDSLTGCTLWLTLGLVFLVLCFDALTGGLPVGIAPLA